MLNCSFFLLFADQYSWQVHFEMSFLVWSSCFADDFQTEESFGSASAGKGEKTEDGKRIGFWFFFSNCQIGCPGLCVSLGISVPGGKESISTR